MPIEPILAEVFAVLVAFTLNGQSYQALNGGAPADYGTAASIAVACPDQAEVDRLWAALAANGGSEIACGWLRDRWGVPWQIFPEALPRLLADPDPALAARVFVAMQGMVKLDLAALERAAVGGMRRGLAGRTNVGNAPIAAVQDTSVSAPERTFATCNSVYSVEWEHSDQLGP